MKIKEFRKQYPKAITTQQVTDVLSALPVSIVCELITEASPQVVKAVTDILSIFVAYHREPEAQVVN